MKCWASSALPSGRAISRERHREPFSESRSGKSAHPVSWYAANATKTITVSKPDQNAIPKNIDQGHGNVIPQPKTLSNSELCQIYL
jgi:hypothetical protein